VESSKKIKIAAIGSLALIVILILFQINRKYEEWQTFTTCSQFPQDCYQELNKFISKSGKDVSDSDIIDFLSTNTILNHTNELYVTEKDGFLLVNKRTKHLLSDSWDTEKDSPSKINYSNLERYDFLDFLFANESSFTIYYN